MYINIYNVYKETLYKYSDRENKNLLVSLSEEATGGGREKENVRE
jgi:hypothetical protein